MKQCWFTLKDMHTSIRKDFLAQIANQTDFYQILIDPSHCIGQLVWQGCHSLQLRIGDSISRVTRFLGPFAEPIDFIDDRIIWNQNGPIAWRPSSDKFETRARHHRTGEMADRDQRWAGPAPALLSPHAPAPSLIIQQPTAQFRCGEESRRVTAPQPRRDPHHRSRGYDVSSVHLVTVLRRAVRRHSSFRRRGPGDHRLPHAQCPTGSQTLRLSPSERSGVHDDRVSMSRARTTLALTPTRQHAAGCRVHTIAATTDEAHRCPLLADDP